MVQVVLPNDTNPMGLLCGAVMHLVDIACALPRFRHARELMVTAAVDGSSSSPIRLATSSFSRRVDRRVHNALEGKEVYSEEALTGRRHITTALT